ncbi:MAG: hypothetical protein KBT20_01190 [Bacteroidales bacterium]|nr:hypothetical protein [Candidatus Liminaster caballi]
MTIEVVTNQMAINNEIAVLGGLKEYLSYKEADKENRFFVAGDNMFTRKARLLQSIRRWQTGAKEGFREYKGEKTYHGNLAENAHETGVNFLHHEIFDYVKKRISEKKPYETIEENRMMNNFLSSQPMAFNLFYPLMQIVECEDGQSKLANVVNTLLHDSVKIEKVIKVGLEFIPSYYKQCLNDKTAMDAFFRFVTKDGKTGIIAIETKYTDVLGQNEARNPLHAREATQREGIKQLFHEDALEEIKLGKTQLNQVYRNFLLTECVRIQENLDYSLSIVLAPQDNVSNKEDETKLINILKDEYKYKFQVFTLENFVEVLIAEFPEESIFKRFRHRYLDFRTAEYLLR